MAFSTRRGRPPRPAEEKDTGTAELRLKHALGLTSEPIDRCLERGMITPAQHWCGLHLRWLYTLRYGAPVITSRYAHEEVLLGTNEDDPLWRQEREQEYAQARTLLVQEKYYESVMRLCVYNELPAFLSEALRRRAWRDRHLAERLHDSHQRLRGGLELLARHWKR